jgi:hypothetical protein
VVGQPNEFDVELLGDCDVVISEICGKLGWQEAGIATTRSSIKLSSEILSKDKAPVEPAAHREKGARDEGARAQAHVEDSGGAPGRTLAQDKSGKGESGKDESGKGESPSGALSEECLPQGQECWLQEAVASEESLLQEAVASGCVVHHRACTYLFRSRAAASLHVLAVLGACGC